MLDAHGQPHPKFNYHHNKRKALHTWLGIMDGAVSDLALNEHEVLFLNTWLLDHSELQQDTDVQEIFSFTQYILTGGRIEQSVLCDMRGTIHAILDSHDGGEITDTEKDLINYLIGIIHGIASDRQLLDAEITRLQNWIHTTQDGLLTDKWPCNVLLHRIGAALDDGVITDAERADLLSTLEQVTGGGIDVGAAGGMSTTLPYSPITTIQIPKHHFCFTGKFIYGSRAKCIAATAFLNGVIAENVSGTLDYLIVGGVASRDWAHSSYGRKIEKAVKLEVAIIPEEIWAKHLF